MPDLQTLPSSGTSTADVSTRTSVLVLAIFPWALLAITTDWIYSEAGLIDPWLYHGYFHFLPQFISDFFPGTYYGTRMAWLLPGYVLYSVLPATVANLALHFGFFYASVFALYRTGAILSTRSAALLSACAYGTSMPILVAFGWDYVDGAVITYTSLAIWAVVEASARPRHRALLLMIAGGAAACVVHSNLGAVLITPAFFIAYWYTHPERRWRDAAAGLAGIVLATGVLGAVSAAAGGPFLFFMPSVRWVVGSIGTQPFIPTPPLKWPGSARFVLPLAGLVAVSAAFAVRRTPATRVTLFMLLWLTTAFAAHDWILSAALLQTQYYVSWFMPLACLGLAVALGRSAPGPVLTIVLCVGVMALQAIALIGIPGRVRLMALARLGSNLRPVEVVIAAIALLVISALSASSLRRRWHVVVVAGALVLANFIVVPNLGYGPSSLGKSQFDAVQQMVTFIREHVPRTKRPPLFWTGTGRAGTYFTSLASTHLYLYALIGDRYPRLPDDTAKPGRFGAVVKPMDYVIVAADKPADEATVRQEFQRFNMDATIQATTPVRTRHASFALTLLRITDKQ